MSLVRSATTPDVGATRLLDLARPALDRRLDPSARAPIAVGMSGGGDSTALMLAALAWARCAGRPVVALIVDHRLQPDSAVWAAAAAAAARRRGADARVLVWEGDKPHAGLPAAARRARHAMLAGGARAAGARVLLLGHTADDLDEAAWMRGRGSTVSSPREWAPSPAWPEGRELFLLRPWLGVRRAELRLALGLAGEGWIEDPANGDLAYARARARQALAQDPVRDLMRPDAGDGGLAALARLARCDAAGTVVIARRHLIDAGPGVAARFLAAASVCAGGGDRLPRTRQLVGLAARLGEGEPLVAGLAGARLQAGEDLLVFREPGEARRAGAGALELPPGAVQVWDGRFEALAESPGWSLRPLGGRMRRLPPAQRRGLRALAAASRPVLPAASRGAELTCPILAGGGEVNLRSLVGARLAGTCGLIAQEAEVFAPSHGVEAFGALS